MTGSRVNATPVTQRFRGTKIRVSGGADGGEPAGAGCGLVCTPMRVPLLH